MQPINTQGERILLLFTKHGDALFVSASDVAQLMHERGQAELAQEFCERAEQAEEKLRSQADEARSSSWTAKSEEEYYPRVAILPAPPLTQKDVVGIWKAIAVLAVLIFIAFATILYPML